ncbi:MAG: CPBP family intramembrane glutamic endopeptidase [Akkermansia sp.]
MDTSPLAALPLYQQINLALVAVSGLVVLIACLLGAKKRRLSLADFTASETLVFPLPIDYLYTVVIISLITLLNISSVFITDTADTDGAASSWADPIIFFALHIPIFIRLFQTRKAFDKPHTPIMAILGYLILAYGATFLSNALVHMTPLLSWFTDACGSPEMQESLDVFSNVHWGDLLPHIVLACLVAPIVEECLFRGMLYPCLKKFVTPCMAAILCGILFGAIHMALPQFVALSVLGALLCFIYERSRRLWIPIFIHAVFNSVNVILAIHFKDIEAYLKSLEQTAQNL